MSESLTVCVWGQYSYSDIDMGTWQTDCGQIFCFIEDGPKENEMKYCCYCGKTLTEQPYKEEFES